MTKLSPAAQAVINAYNQKLPPDNEPGGLAAALCAAVDRAVPRQDPPDAEEWIGQASWIQAEQHVRFRLLAIASELRAGVIIDHLRDTNNA